MSKPMPTEAPPTASGKSAASWSLHAVWPEHCRPSDQLLCPQTTFDGSMSNRAKESAAQRRATTAAVRPGSPLPLDPLRTDCDVRDRTLHHTGGYDAQIAAGS